MEREQLEDSGVDDGILNWILEGMAWEEMDWIYLPQINNSDGLL